MSGFNPGSGGHKCPIPNCGVYSIPKSRIMCRGHWQRVPSDVQRRVWNTWRDGLGAGTPEHTASVRAAIESMRAVQRV